MAMRFGLPDSADGMVALAGCENALWRYGRDGLGGRLSETWQSGLENWLTKIQSPSFWDRYGSGKGAAQQLATGMGQVILASAALKGSGDAEGFVAHLQKAIAAYSTALDPRAVPTPTKAPGVTWSRDESLINRLRLVDDYLNELERSRPGEGRRALGMVRSALSDLVEPGEDRILLGRFVFQARLPVAVVLDGEGAGKGAGRAYWLTVEWFDRLDGKSLLVRNPAALGCSVLDREFAQAEDAAWAVAVGYGLFRKQGFVRWGTDIEPDLSSGAVAIGGPSVGGALATALVSLGEKRRPVRALVLARLLRKSGAETTAGAADALYEVGGVADKALAASSSETLRVHRLVLWHADPDADAPEIGREIDYLREEREHLTITRLRTVREVVDHLSSRRIRVREWVRNHPRAARSIGAVLGIFLLVMIAGSAWAYSSYLEIKSERQAQIERDERIAARVRQLESDLDLEEWPLDRMKDSLEAMVQDDLQTADANWIKLAEKLRDRINANPHLKKDEVNRYQAALRLLESHDSGLAEAVRAVLEPRRTHLQLQWELPREDVEKIFGPQTVTVENGLLVLSKAKKDNPATRIVTLEKCGPAGAQLEARYDNSWLEEARLDLEVNAVGEKSGYVFSLRTVENGPLGRREMFRDARLRKGGKIELSISRNNVPLHIENRDADLLPGDALTMTATREGSILTLQVGDLQPFVFEDLFALSSKESEAGNFALLWPKGVRLVTLKARVVARPQKLSPLEEGDRLYVEDRYAEALSAYKEQAERPNAPEVEQEIRYKQGLCLVAQGETESAKKMLKGLSEEKGKTWSLYACVQLWNLYILHDQMDLADELLDNYIRQYDRFDLAKLVRCIPNETRVHILATYRNIVPILHGRNLSHTQRLNAAKRWVKVEELMKGDATESRICLGWTYHLAGYPEEAIRELSALYRQSARLDLLGEYVWLLRRTKSVDAALKLVEQEEKKYRGPGVLYLELLKAECAYAQGKWEKIEALSQQVDGPGAPRELCRAWLMIGFAHEQKGNEAAAKKAWAEASKWAERPTDRGGLLMFLLSRSLAGVSDQTDVHELRKRALNAQPDSPLDRFVPLLLNEGGLVKVAGEMWRTREGRELGRKLVFRDLSLAEQFSQPPTLALFEYARQHAFGGSQDPQQLKVCWQVAESVFRHGVENFARELVPQALSALPGRKGNLNQVAIDTLLKALPESDCAPAAFVAAHRMLHLRQLQEAAHYFKLSWDYAQKTDDQALKNLIKIDRELLDAKKGRLMILSDTPAKVPLILRGDKGVTIKELANQDTLDLEVGRYRVELGKDAGSVSAFPSEIDITCCGRATILIKNR